jgi:hypothetical protein
MKNTLAFLLLTSLLLRLWFAVGYWSGKPLTHDANEYLELARNYNEKGAFMYEVRPGRMIENYGRAPGYPFWLAMLLRVEPTLGWIRLAEVIVSLFSTYLLFVLARQLFNLRSALVTLVLALFYAPMILLLPSILSENLWIALMLVSYWFLLRVSKLPSEHRYFHLVGAYFFLGLATLVRPAAVFILPLYLVRTYRAANWKASAALLLLYFLLLLPWNLNLYRQHGRFIFVASEGGVTFWTGTHPYYSGDGDLAANPPVQAEYRKLLSLHSAETPEQREQVYLHEAFRNIVENPLRFLMIEAKKLLFWFLPFGASVQRASLLHRIASMLFYLPVLALTIAGFKTLSPDLRTFFAGAIASFTIMILIFFPQERFRIATLDPFFLLIGSQELARRLGFRLSKLL